MSESLVEVLYKEKKIDEKTFVNNALNELAVVDSPKDIFEKSVFGGVENIIDYRLCGEGYYVITYSASAGYKREENYLGKNSKGELVEKTKTVIDWHPINGEEQVKESSDISINNKKNFEFNENNFKDSTLIIQDEEIVSKIPADLGNVPDGKEMVSKSELLDSIMQDRISMFFKISLKSKYDDIKNLNINIRLIKMKLKLYCLPASIIEYKYEEKDYYMSSYLDGNSKVYVTFPKDTSKLNKKDIENNAKKELNPKLKFPVFGPTFTRIMIALIILVIINLYLINDYKFRSISQLLSILNCVYIILFIASMIYYKKCQIKLKEVIKHLTSEEQKRLDECVEYKKTFINKITSDISRFNNKN